MPLLSNRYRNNPAYACMPIWHYLQIKMRSIEKNAYLRRLHKNYRSWYWALGKRSTRLILKAKPPTYGSVHPTDIVITRAYLEQTRVIIGIFSEEDSETCGARPTHSIKTNHIALDTLWSTKLIKLLFIFSLALWEFRNGMWLMFGWIWFDHSCFLWRSQTTFCLPHF